MPYAVDYLGNYSSRTPFLCFVHWRQSYCPRRQKPNIFYDLCSYRCGHQHNSGSPFHLLGLVGESKGAAWATVIRQVASGILVIIYFGKFRKMYLEMSRLKPSSECLKAIISLGLASCINQIAMAVVQIVLNNILRYYGGLSVYGSDIPIACVGVISKVNRCLWQSVLVFLRAVSQSGDLTTEQRNTTE